MVKGYKVLGSGFWVLSYEFWVLRCGTIEIENQFHQPLRVRQIRDLEFYGFKALIL